MKKLLIVTSLILSTLAANAEALKPGAERDSEVANARELQKRMQGYNTGIKCANESGNVIFELKPDAENKKYELVRTIDSRATTVVTGLDCVISGLTARCDNNAEGDALETVNMGSALIEKANGQGEARSVVTLQVKSLNIPEVVNYKFENGKGRCEPVF